MGNRPSSAVSPKPLDQLPSYSSSFEKEAASGSPPDPSTSVVAFLSTEYESVCSDHQRAPETRFKHSLVSLEVVRVGVTEDSNSPSRLERLAHPISMDHPSLPKKQKGESCKISLVPVSVHTSVVFSNFSHDVICVDFPECSLPEGRPLEVFHLHHAPPTPERSNSFEVIISREESIPRIPRDITKIVRIFQVDGDTADPPSPQLWVAVVTPNEQKQWSYVALEIRNVRSGERVSGGRIGASGDWGHVEDCVLLPSRNLFVYARHEFFSVSSGVLGEYTMDGQCIRSISCSGFERGVLASRVRIGKTLVLGGGSRVLLLEDFRIRILDLARLGEESSMTVFKSRDRIMACSVLRSEEGTEDEIGIAVAETVWAEELEEIMDIPRDVLPPVLRFIRWKVSEGSPELPDLSENACAAGFPSQYANKYHMMLRSPEGKRVVWGAPKGRCCVFVNKDDGNELVRFVPSLLDVEEEEARPEESGILCVEAQQMTFG